MSILLLHLLLSDSVLKSYFLYLKGSCDLKENTIENYIVIFKRLQKWLDGRPLTHKTAIEYLIHLKECGLGYSSNENFRNFVASFCKFRKTSCPPLPKMKRVQTVINTLTIEEIKKIINCERNYRFPELEKFWTLFIECLARMPRRVSELTELKVCDLDFARSAMVLRDPKNRIPTWLPVPEDLNKRLEEWCKNKEPGDFVFTNYRTKSKVATSTVREELKVRAKLAGIKKRVHPHLFRHSFPVELLRMGVPLPLVSALLTHKDFKITARYTHLVLDDMRTSLSFHPLNQETLSPKDVVAGIKRDISKYQNIDRSDMDIEICEKGGEFNLSIKW